MSVVRSCQDDQSNFDLLPFSYTHIACQENIATSFHSENRGNHLKDKEKSIEHPIEWAKMKLNALRRLFRSRKQTGDRMRKSFRLAEIEVN